MRPLAAGVLGGLAMFCWNILVSRWWI